MIANFPIRKPGDMPTAEEWNALVKEVVRLGKFHVAPPLGMDDSAGGIGISFHGETDPDACVVRLDDTCAGGGKYDGVIMNPPSTLACAAPDLNMPEGMEEGDPCIVSNLSEDGDATHGLTANGTTYHNGVIMGQDDNGNWLVSIEVGAGSCSPGVATLTVLIPNSTYDGTDFKEYAREYEFDFCAGTITPTGAAVPTTVFSTEACDDVTSPAAGERVFAASRTISTDEFYAVADYVKLDDSIALTISDGATLEIT